MPKLNKIPTDYETDPMSRHIERAMEEIAMHASYPMFICGVNRRVGLGNFEHIDVYSGLTVPLIGVLPSEDMETFKQAITDAAELCFGMASMETYNRYAAIKEMQKGGRPSKP